MSAELRIEKIALAAFDAMRQFRLAQANDDPTDRAEYGSPDDARESAALEPADQRANGNAYQGQCRHPRPQCRIKQNLEAGFVHAHQRFEVRAIEIRQRTQAALNRLHAFNRPQA